MANKDGRWVAAVSLVLVGHWFTLCASFKQTIPCISVFAICLFILSNTIVQTAYIS